MVDTSTDAQSAAIADSKMHITYDTGDVIINNKLGIGTTSPDYGKLQIDNASGNTLTLRKGAGTPALAYGGVTGNQAIALVEGKTGGGLKWYFGAGTLASPTWTAAMELYDGGRLHPYGGVFLGSSNNSNLLDDYEEGTFTATTNNDGVGQPVTANYTKIGQLVTYTVYIPNWSPTSAGTAVIAGFPFTAITTNGYGIGNVTHSTGVLNCSGGYHDGTNWNGTQNNSTGRSSWVVAGSRSIMVTGFYYTA